MTSAEPSASATGSRPSPGGPGAGRRIPEGTTGGSRRPRSPDSLPLRFARRIGSRGFLIAGVLAALAVRIPPLSRVSSDMNMSLIPWYDFIVANGGFAALRHDFGDYNVPYLYLLTLATLSASWLPKVWAIKTMSIVFDFVLAFFVGKCVALRYPDSPWIPKAAAVTTLLLPSVVLNSAWWGQADSMWTAFLAAGLHSLLAGHQGRAFAAFGLAFAVKMQAVFLAPLFLWLAVRRAVDWRSFVWSPLVWFVTLLPAWFLGRPLADLLTIYLDQAAMYGALTMRAQNLYQWVPDRFFAQIPVFVALAVAVLAAIAVPIHRSRLRLTPQRIVFLAAFAVLVAPYILPKMHGRFFFAAEILSLILAFRSPRYWYAPVVLQLASFNIYVRGLEYYWLVPPSWLAVPLGLLIFVLALDFRAQSADGTPPPVRRTGRLRSGLFHPARSRFLPGALVAATLAILSVGVVRRAQARLEARRSDIARLEALRESIRSGRLDPPLLRSTFDLYLDRAQLVFFREPCAPADTEARFLLSLHPPENPDAEPGARPAPEIRPRNRDFDFEERGRRLDRACVATVELPETGIAGIAAVETGQWDGSQRTWRAVRRLDRERFRSALDSIASGALGEPLVRSDFDLYLAGTELLYHRRECAPEDAEPRFFLHLFPSATSERGGDPAPRNRDFDFAERGLRLGRECLGIVPLPPEGIEIVKTGQWIGDEEPFWRGVLRLDRGRFRARLDSVAAGEPLARSAFDLYRRGTELIYHREPCAAEEVEAGFFLQVFSPGDPARGGRRTMENRDFLFEDRGLRTDGRCLAIVELPGEGAAAVRTGQGSADESPLWEAAFRLDPERYRSRLDAIAGGALGEPLASTNFDLYLGENELLYHRERCAAAEVETRFFVHLTPAGRVPREERDAFGSREFAFGERGVRNDGQCLAIFPLEPRRVATIDTGQQQDGTALWRTYLRFDADGRAARSGSAGAMERGEPAVASVFDLHYDGTTLSYLKEPCTAEDTTARFFLHLVPSDLASLPPDARGAGFENRDFSFPDYGLHLDGRCAARVPLPPWRIARLRTGQFVSGGRRLWEAAFSPAEGGGRD